MNGAGVILFIIAFSAVAMLILGGVGFGRVLFHGSVTHIKAKRHSDVPATVKGKYKVDKMRSSGIYTIYFVNFQLDKDDFLEFPVSKKIYKKYDVGTEGYLSYKGSYFIDFTTAPPPKEQKKETYILNGEIVEK
ncbi:MAG: DUF2500 family protein [Clostridia bacterium]|nr:DUF2500 family protein [Clostridia bacterium]